MSAADVSALADKLFAECEDRTRNLSDEDYLECYNELIKRTSPVGEAFVGTCLLCDTPNLTTADVNKSCPRPDGLTQDDALMRAIEGESE